MKRQTDGWLISDEEYYILTLIADGHATTGSEDRYIVVENSDYRIEKGNDPYRVLSVVDKDDY